MRLSTVCELLLIFLIIAFGAYGRVIERNADKPRQIAKSLKNDKNIGVSLMSLKDATENVNKYCQCDGVECTCCRAFPLIGINILKDEGCAVLKYVENNSLKVQLKYGGRELATRVIKGKSPAPICIPLPGGYSDFCAKVYSIKREENNQFKACLGLELKSGGDVEAAVRVSCFRFGQEGIKQLPAEDFPIITTSPKPAEDDDDDYFSFVDDDDDDEDEDDEDSDDSEAPVKDNVETPQKPDTDEDEDDDDEDDDDDDDDLGLGDISGIFDFFTGGDDNKKKPSSTTTTSPFIISTVTKQPAVSAPSSSTANNKKPVITTSTSTTSSTANNKKPVITTSTSTTSSTTTTTTTTQQPPKTTTNKPDKNQDNKTEKIPEITTETALESTTVHQDNDITTEQTFDSTTPKEAGEGLVTEESSTTDISNPTESTLETTTFVSEKIEEKPIKASESIVDIVTTKPEIPAMVVKKIILGTHKKASAGSSNLNKIENDKQKPLIKPTKADSTPVQQVTPTNNNDIIDLGELVGLTSDEETESVEDDDDDDDDEETENNSNEEEKDENVKVGETDKPDNDDDEEEADILDSLDDDSEEQEVDAAINAIVGTDNNKNKNNNNNKIKNNDKISDKVADNMASKPEDDDADYGMNLAEFMARGRHINSGRSRQSKVMRL